MANNNYYKVDFSIDKLTMAEQQKVFEAVIKCLDYSKRQDLHVTVTDYLGGQHFIWDNQGISPDGIGCKHCNMISCADCIIYDRRRRKEKETKEEK